ncbi:hypothetical protein NDU88_002019 [Pleurodeles waltl]|uniref:Uncharacterized protein n=1 Tax=Pleurodeles waltl TaxID=8319 RepID=A0AAV7Q7R5_PLEWA|nr:hypothetical protein NDU88_002019 [Pleurodeles waltl]
MHFSHSHLLWKGAGMKIHGRAQGPPDSLGDPPLGRPPATVPGLEAAKASLAERESWGALLLRGDPGARRVDAARLASCVRERSRPGRAVSPALVQ